MRAIVFAIPFLLFVVLWALLYRPLAGAANLVKIATNKGGARIARTGLGKWAIRISPWRTVPAYAPVVLLIAGGAIAAVVAGILFIGIAAQVSSVTSLAYRFDHTVWSWFHDARQSGVTTLFRAVTMIGSTAGLAIIMLVAAGFLLYKREHASALFVAVASVGGMLLNTGLKLVYARERPDLAAALTSTNTFSFPSGHAMSTFIVCGAVFFVALRQKWPWKVKSAVLAAAMTLVLLVSLSRIYLGVHWISDILGGWIAGVVWLTSTILAFDVLLRLRQRRRGAKPSAPAADVPDLPDTPARRRRPRGRRATSRAHSS